MQATLQSPRYAAPFEPIFPISVETFEGMIASGLIGEDDPVELIEGVLVLKMGSNEPHETTVGLFQDWLPTVLLPGWIVRLEKSLRLRRSLPEPDVAVVRGTRSDYAARRPTSADVALVVEISEATLAYDRAQKLAMYADAGIAEYWIVNLIDRQIEIYTQPDAAGPETRYLSRIIRTAGEQVALPATLGSAAIAVADLLLPIA